MKNKKKLILIIQLLFVGLLFLFNTGCGEEDISLASVTTLEVTEITEVTAVGGGSITNDGGGDIFGKGVCYSTSTGPTIDDGATNDGFGAESFTSNISGLTLGTDYYLRSFAINKAGITYGNEVTFSTLEPAGVDCVAELWVGDLDAKDLVWSAPYHPTYCTGEKMEEDCSLLNVTFDFWGYGVDSEVTLKLQIEPFDPATYEGVLTLLEDASTTAEGYEITFHEGAAGTYKILTGELLLDVVWSGYDATATYKWNITP
jgi:hypothetical protein